MNGQPLLDLPWIAAHVGLIWQRFLQHLELAIVPVALGFAISLASGSPCSATRGPTRP